MEWQRWHVEAGPLPTRPHSFWPTSSGGEPLITDVASSPSTASGARAATRARGQPSDATRPPAYGSSGSGKNHPTMDGARGALLPLAADFRLRASQARWGCSLIPCRGRGTCEQKLSDEAFFQNTVASLDSTMMKNDPEMGLQRLIKFSTINCGCTQRGPNLLSPSRMREFGDCP